VQDHSPGHGHTWRARCWSARNTSRQTLSKKRLLDGATDLFQTGAKSSSAEHEAFQAQLFEQSVSSRRSSTGSKKLPALQDEQTSTAM
jgi:hypothetical protein